MSWYTKDPKAYFTTLRFKTLAQENRLIKIVKQRIVAYPPSYVLKKALEQHKEGVAVLWSGGRCSTAVIHMMLKIDANVKVIFVNTGVEYPETVRYVEELGKMWGLNLYILKPKRTFWEIVKSYGLPTMRRPSNRRKINDPDTPQCCYWLKKKPVSDFVKENGISALITGVRAGESTVRAIAFCQKGSQFYYVKKEKLWKYHPLAVWSTEQVARYLLKNSIPLNPLYTKMDRVGCWPCTSYFHWEKNLSEVNPSLFRVLKRMVNNMSISPCTEGKPMSHLVFKDRITAKKFADLMSTVGVRIEVHEDGRTICLPS